MRCKYKIQKAEVFTKQVYTIRKNKLSMIEKYLKNKNRSEKSGQTIKTAMKHPIIKKKKTTNKRDQNEVSASKKNKIR